MARPTSPGRVLVTGASGFTGGHLCPLLESQGYEVAAFEGDLRDAEAVRSFVREQRPDYAIHLAALSFVAHEPARDFYDINLFGSLNLLDALALESPGVRKVILASTANLYGAAVQPVLDEGVCPRPLNHYGASKLAMEHLAATYFQRLPLLITRPFNYTGPGQSESFLIPKIVAHYRRGERSIELGNLDVARDFSDVRDIAEDYWRLLSGEASGELVNLCSGVATPLRSILELLADLCGYAIEVRVNPAFVRKNEIPSLRGSREKLDRLTGQRERRSLRSTLEAMLSD